MVLVLTKNICIMHVTCMYHMRMNFRAIEVLMFLGHACLVEIFSALLYKLVVKMTKNDAFGFITKSY